MEIRNQCFISLGASLDSVILDIEDDKAKSFKDNAEKIWNFAASAGKFACIDLEVVTSKLDEHKAEVERLQVKLDDALQELNKFKSSVEKENVTTSSTGKESMESASGSDIRVPDRRHYYSPPIQQPHSSSFLVWSGLPGLPGLVWSSSRIQPTTLQDLDKDMGLSDLISGMSQVSTRNQETQTPSTDFEDSPAFGMFSSQLNTQDCTLRLTARKGYNSSKDVKDV